MHLKVMIMVSDTLWGQWGRTTGWMGAPPAHSPGTPMMRVRHAGWEMRERRAGAQRRREKTEEEGEEVRADPASGHGSAADPYPQPVTLAAEKETRQGGSRGAANAPWPQPAALGSAQCPAAARLHRSRAPHGSRSRAPEAAPHERAAAPGQNEGHLHPKRRFRRSFLAF